MRKITVGGQDFRYKVGRTCVDIRCSDGSRVYPSHAEVSGLPQEEVERGQHKRWFSVTPSMLREYIEKNLLTQEQA